MGVLGCGAAAGLMAGETSSTAECCDWLNPDCCHGRYGFIRRDSTQTGQLNSPST